MVKFSNRGKSKASKRKTLKTKYKIERKVKQHKKKLRKEAKKLQAKGIRPSNKKDIDPLPNAFPFKPAIVQEYLEKVTPVVNNALIRLTGHDFGLKTIDNNFPYLPKARDILLKKYVNNLEAIFDKCTVVIEILEARCPEMCIDEAFRKQCLAHKIKFITVVCKTDTVDEIQLKKAISNIKPLSLGEIFYFSTDSRKRKDYLEKIAQELRSYASQSVTVFVSGKTRTGKHTFLQNLLKHFSKAHDDNLELYEVVLDQNLSILDAPYEIADSTDYPLFWGPSAVEMESSIAKEEKILRHLLLGGYGNKKEAILDRDEVLIHYMIEDFNSIDDAIKKIGRTARLFGKGGMVDVSRTRRMVLLEWYSGKLNNAIKA